jgi:prepilin signal peptidase PulO-like enzyme (type II secretory pathway)
MTILFAFVFGTAIGSFLSAFTYRLLTGENIAKGRSHCDHCGKQIVWYDNIPLISYLILKGKCRNCGKKIPIDYFLTEFFTGCLFVLIYLAGLSGNQLFVNSPFSIFFSQLGLPYLVFAVILISLLVIIFLTDLKEMFIPDFAVNLLIILNFLTVIFASPWDIFYWDFLFAGFILATFLLFLNFVTRGSGMGLGDVKLVIALGFVTGLKLGYVFMSLSFIIGAVVGLFLISVGKAKFGRRIPFGPFIVISFFATYFFGGMLTKVMLPGI